MVTFLLAKYKKYLLNQNYLTITDSIQIFIAVFTIFMLFLLCQTIVVSRITKIFTQEIRAILDNPYRQCLQVHEMIVFNNEYKRYLEYSKNQIEVQSQFEKSQAIEKFVSCIIHDIKKPFSMLELIVNALKSTTNQKLREKLIKTVEIDLDRSIKNTKKMIGDILDYGKTVKSEQQDVNISAVINESLEELGKIKHESKSRIIEYSNPSNFNVKGDLHSLKRVIQNILWNAVEHTASKDTIKIECTKNSSSIEVEILNTGSYIEKHLLDKIFEPYFTMKKYSGTGLGLSICKKIVEDLSGKITCISCPDKKWTKFVITLQRSDI